MGFRGKSAWISSSRLWGVAVATAIVSGVLTTPATAWAAPQSSLRWGACDRVHGASPQTQCAVLRVPRDYADPAGPTIAVTVSRIPARDQSRKRGVLVGNPGGPGGDAISMFTSLRPPAAVGDLWDLVAVQPRGLVGATPVRCDRPQASLDLLVATGRVNRQRCEKNTPGYTATLTTETTARDIEQVRKALGVNRISLYGISYGTLLMSTYATLFARHTDRLVLDSSVDPAWIWNRILAEQTSGYKARVYAMMAWIAQHNNIYHLGRTPLEVYRTWSAKVSAQAGVPPSLAAPPAQVGDVPPGLRAVAEQYIAGVNLTADVRARFENLLATLLAPERIQLDSSLLVVTRLVAPDRNSWPLVALQMLGRLTVPPWSKAQENAAAVSGEMQQLMLCNENQVPAQPADLPAAFVSNYVVGDVFEAPGLVYRSGMACAGAAPVTRPVAVANRGLATRPLQIQSVGDPQTPYGGALALRRLMGSHLITVGGGDHGQLGRSNPALDAAITEYLNTGRTSVTSVPEAAISTPLLSVPPTLGAGTAVPTAW